MWQWWRNGAFFGLCHVSFENEIFLSCVRASMLLEGNFVDDIFSYSARATAERRYSTTSGKLLNIIWWLYVCTVQCCRLEVLEILSRHVSFLFCSLCWETLELKFQLKFYFWFLSQNCYNYTDWLSKFRKVAIWQKFKTFVEFFSSSSSHRNVTVLILPFKDLVLIFCKFRKNSFVDRFSIGLVLIRFAERLIWPWQSAAIAIENNQSA